MPAKLRGYGISRVLDDFRLPVRVRSIRSVVLGRRKLTRGLVLGLLVGLWVTPHCVANSLNFCNVVMFGSGSLPPSLCCDNWNLKVGRRIERVIIGFWVGLLQSKRKESNVGDFLCFLWHAFSFYPHTLSKVKTLNGIFFSLGRDKKVSPKGQKVAV
ncbi:hypothetical protein GQ457_04G006330 [Hibiscus cannabinus]